MQAFLKHPFDLSLQLETNNVGPGKQNEINWIFPKLSKMKKCVVLEPVQWDYLRLFQFVCFIYL